MSPEEKAVLKVAMFWVCQRGLVGETLTHWIGAQGEMIPKTVKIRSRCTAHKAELSITHNQHKCFHHSVMDYVENRQIDDNPDSI